MQFIHRVSMSSSDEASKRLRELKVTATIGPVLTFFDINETNPSWPEVKAWIDKDNLADLVSTKFSKAELVSSNWLEMCANWHHGYPLPDTGHAGYMIITYEQNSHCSQCGMGKVQQAPFIMKGEPKWGTRHIMQLNWVFDEYFVTPEAYRIVFEPHGVHSREVQDKTGKPLKSVVQLVSTEQISIDVSDEKRVICSMCGNAKFERISRGFSPSLISQPKGSYVNTKQSFGDGAAAHKLVYVSSSLYKSILAAGLKGVSFRAVNTN